MTGHPLMFAQGLRRTRRTVRPGDRFRIYRASFVAPGKRPRWILEAFSDNPHEQVLIPDVVRQPRSTRYGIQYVHLLVHDRPQLHVRFGTWKDAGDALATIHNHLAKQANR